MGDHERSPIKKQLDRLTFLKSNCTKVIEFTGIPAERIVLKSALLTDYLVPMQFSEKLKSIVDVVTDFTMMQQYFE